MNSNEERREVAARLRNYEGLRESFRESPICAFINALGFGGYLDWKDICNRLADLIEPEPEPERTCRYKHIEGTWYKTSCGERYDGVVPPNYCPNCGAKVIANERRKNG